MDYNKLSKEVHQAQKDAGWYDKYRSDNVLLLLIKSELFEALEAYRKEGDPVPLDSDYMNKLLGLSQSQKEVFVVSFKEFVKNSFADELADIVIRILDYAGYKKQKITMMYGTMIYYPVVLDAILALDNYITMLYNNVVSGYDLFCMIGMVENIANQYEINLEQHIKLKLAYNKTRGIRHGNKVL